MNLKQTVLNEMYNQLNEVTTSDLEKLLKTHDFTFARSDDNRKYQAGSTNYSKIVTTLRSLYSNGTSKSKLQSIWKKYAPNGINMPSLETPAKSNGKWE